MLGNALQDYAGLAGVGELDGRLVRNFSMVVLVIKVSDIFGVTADQLIRDELDVD